VLAAEAVRASHGQRAVLRPVGEGGRRRHVAFHNWNARCFIAIDIENQSSRKHLMGSAINAGALGRIGVAVGWDQQKVNQFVRMRRYLRLLSSLGKNSFSTANLLVLHREQLVEAVARTGGRRPPE
jgi:hypothetical protein